MKTMKDLVFENGKTTRAILRDVAIEWIRWFDANSDTIKVYNNETRSSDEAYMVIEDQEFLHKCDIDTAKRIVSNRKTIRDWIKHFFNISEEDLK